jgi:hypothetical protein
LTGWCVGVVARAGVSWNKTQEQWQAQLYAKGRTLHLGDFGAEVDAARAYDVTARVVLGDTALLNFTETTPPEGFDFKEVLK